MGRGRVSGERGREVEGRGGEGKVGERDPNQWGRTEVGLRREGRGIPVSEVVSAPYTNSVCWNGSVL